jgi:hypothetical protein
VHTTPARPYGVFEIADDPIGSGEFVGRLTGDDARLRTAIDADDLSIVFDPNTRRWTTVAGHFNPDLRVRLGGEVVEVSGIATTAATVLGHSTSPSHVDNASVTPTLPGASTTNDLLLLVAAIRNSGTGYPNAPSGWTRLPVFGATDNVQVFARVRQAGDANPTVTFTGGVAGATCSARITALRGMPITLDDLADMVVASATQLNAAAADIALPAVYPWLEDGCVVFYVAWKQDDFSAASTPSGFTEAYEMATVTGDDHGIVVGYKIQTTGEYVAPATLTITGGAAVISRVAVFALSGGYQTMTVSARSVNGVEKSHAAGTRIEVEDAYVLGL